MNQCPSLAGRKWWAQGFKLLRGLLSTARSGLGIYRGFVGLAFKPDWWGDAEWNEANEESTHRTDFLITVQSSDNIRDTRMVSEWGRPFYEAINNVLMESAEKLLGTVNQSVTTAHVFSHPQL